MNKRMTQIQQLTACVLGTVLLACAGCQQKPPRVYKVTYTEPYSEVDGPATGLASAGSAFNQPRTSGRFLVKTDGPSATASSGYHLGAGDVLEVRIQKLLDPDRETVERVTINQQGRIYLPVLNQLQAAGLTTAELQQELHRRLGQEFIKNPEVDVKITEYRSKEVVVLGVVGRPGSVYLKSDNTTLLDVIGLAGGISGEAAPHIEILRGAYRPGMDTNPAFWDAAWDKPGTPGYFNRDVIAVSKLFAEDGTQVNPLIFPGDVVKIRSAQEGFIYISGEVRQPGAKRFHRPLNVIQAVSMAGGLTKIAEERECRIVRVTADGTEQVTVVDLSKIESGEHRNLELAQNDLIMVPVNPEKKFWSDVASLFHTGVRAGVDMSYDAASDAGIPSGGSGF